MQGRRGDGEGQVGHVGGGSLAEEIQDAEKYDAVVIVGKQLMKSFYIGRTNACRNSTLQLLQQLVDGCVNRSIDVAQPARRALNNQNRS